MTVPDAYRPARADHSGAARDGGRGWAIRGTGAHLPRDVAHSADLSRSLGLEPDWIERRTGIRRRHVVAPGEAASDLAAAAARRALEAAGLDAADLGLIVLGTSTPDVIAPSTACRVQTMLGARRAAAFDISAACTGFVFGLQTAIGWLATQRGAPPYALVVGASRSSRGSRTSTPRSASVPSSTRSWAGT
ncbi:hypothetical protein [Actinomadura sp. NPDC049753]|uniref:3-oxoacyl-ACP synthase III family protein n=1 Tax=Actinomadura sp. NPDC049753 TaxID=3154739 RepID=UPI00343CA8A4